MQRAIAYLRVSTEEQVEKGFSIQAQREECKKKAYELGCIPESILIFSDEGVSGAILERPQLMASLEMLKKGGFNYFITMDTSRLSRNVSHQLMIVDEIKRSGAELVFLKNSYQDNPEGRFQITVMAAVDEYERARLRLRTEMGKIMKAKQHLLTHNPGIYGYSFDVKTDCLYIDEQQANIVKLMFRWFVEEYIGPSEISDRLNEIGIPSPRMKLWNRVTVRRILSNESYTGTLYIRRYDTREYHLNKYKKTSEKVKVVERPRNEWIPVKIPEIIEKATWLKAMNIMKKSKRILKSGKNKEEYLLSSTLKCGYCGCFLNGKHVSNDKKDYKYYMCPTKNRKAANGKCELKLINSEDIEKKTWEIVKKYILDNTEPELDISDIAKKTAAIIEDGAALLNYELEKSKEESSRIITLYQKGFIKEEEISLKLDKLYNKVKMLEGKIENKKLMSKRNYDKMSKIIKEKNIYNNIEAILNKMDKSGKKHIINSLISEIVVSNSCILIKGRL